jgi:phage terminase small subunit
MVKLTQKQKVFCEEYIKDSNGTQAAIRAGYSVASAQQTAASNMLKHVIKQYIVELQTERSLLTKIDAAWVLMSAKKVYDRCMQEEAVTDKEGGTTGEYKFEHSGANAALGIIGKHVDVQAFLEKKEVKNINSELSDEELEMKIRKLVGK